MYSANSTLHYLFEIGFQQCKKPICLALNQENPQLMLFIRGGVSAPHPVHLPISLGNERQAVYRELSWTTPTLLWSVGCLLSPARNIQHSKEDSSFFSSLSQTEGGVDLTWHSKVETGRTNFHREWPQRSHIIGGFCYLLPWISAFNYQDKHLEIFFFTVDNLEASQKENHISS